MKKHLSILAGLFVVAFNVFSQDNKINFGVNLYPNISLPVPVSNSLAPTNNPSVGYHYTYPLYNWIKYSISGNALIRYNVSDKFKLNGGIGYMNNGSTSEMNAATEEALTVAIEKPTVNQHHIEMPLGFDLYLGKRFYWTAGISPVYTFLTTSSTSTGVTKIDSEFYRKLNLYANMGFGIDYIQNDKLSMYLQPYAQYGFLGVGNNVPTNLIMFSFGLSTGIRM